MNVCLWSLGGKAESDEATVKGDSGAWEAALSLVSPVALEDAQTFLHHVTWPQREGLNHPPREGPFKL